GAPLRRAALARRRRLPALGGGSGDHHPERNQGGKALHGIPPFFGAGFSSPPGTRAAYGMARTRATGRALLPHILHHAPRPHLGAVDVADVVGRDPLGGAGGVALLRRVRNERRDRT